MAFDTTIDNEGIKKGLGLVVSQLIQSNKKLGDLNEPNLLKAFKENQAEILASYAQHRQEMSVAREELDYQKKVTKGLKNFSVTKAGVQVDETGKERRPAVDDTLFGQMAKLVDVLKVYTDYDMRLKAKSDEAWLDNKADEEARAAAEAKRKEEEIKEERLGRFVNRSFFKSFIKTSKQNNLETFKRSAELKTNFKKLLDGTLFATTMQTTSILDSNKTFSANLGTGLGNLRNYFFKSDKDKEGKEESRAKKLGKGLLSIGKTIKDTFMKYLGSPFMLLIKGIGLALLTAGVFKFFASPAWQKMKPNIAQSIADGLKSADKMFEKLITYIPAVIDVFKLLVNAVVEVYKFFADFIPSVEVGEEIRADKIAAARADEKNKGMTDKQIEAMVDADIAKIRQRHMMSEAARLDAQVRSGYITQAEADAELAHEMGEFDVNTYGGLQVGDKVTMDSDDIKHLSDVITKNAGNYATAVEAGTYTQNTTMARYYQNYRNQSHFSNLNNQVD